MILGILKSIGVNSTFFYQFVSFLITYLVLHIVAFSKYVRAYSERQQRTVGDQSKAKSILEEVEELNSDYQTEARKLNDQISEIFNKQRMKSNEEYNATVELAKNSAEKAKSEGLAVLTNNFNQAKTELGKMTDELAGLIELKVYGSEQ